MLNLSRQERGVILFLILMIIIGGGVKLIRHLHPQSFLELSIPERKIETLLLEKETRRLSKGKIDINTASEGELKSLPGIGPIKAQAIIAHRSYYNIEEIQKAPGIGPKTLERLREFITVGKISRPKEVKEKKEKIDINRASSEELETLPSIGPVRAQAIIENRPYSSIEKLTKAKGIGKKTLKALKPLITIGEVPPEQRLEIEKKLSQKININTALQKELETLPAIGPVRAQAIIAHRPYYSIGEIQKAPGIGRKTLKRLKELITVGEISRPLESILKPGKIHLNFATQEELETLSHIGPKRAQRIIEYRNTHGPFRNIEDITEISGIGEKTFQDLENKITVEKKDINLVTKGELEALAIIEPKEAEAIIAYRETKGPFKKIRKLRKVPGIDHDSYKYLKRLYTAKRKG